MSRFYARECPNLLRPHLEAALKNRSYAVRNAAKAALILLDYRGRTRAAYWTRDFTRCCQLAGVVR